VSRLHARRTVRLVRSLSLVLLVAGRASSAQIAAVTTPVPPAAEALIARHDSLVGGRAAFERLTSMRLVGTFGVPMVGLEAPLEIVKVRPGRFLLRATLGPMGELLTGHDGTVAWSIQPGQGPRVLQGPEAAMLATQADFFSDLHDLQQFTSMEVRPVERFEGRDAYPVRLVRRSGEVLTEFFDAVTGLSAGVRTSVEGPQGPMEVVAVLADYQRFGDLLLPTTRIQRTSMLETVLRVTTVEYDRADAAATALPESIRALVPPR